MTPPQDDADAATAARINGLRETAETENRRSPWRGQGFTEEADRLETASAIPDDRDLDTVTVMEWRAASLDQRRQFMAKQAARGFASFVCLTCGFPSARGVAFCEACRPDLVKPR